MFCQDIVSMKAKVPDAIFKKAAVSSADAPPMLDMTAVQKAWFSVACPPLQPEGTWNLAIEIRVTWRNVPGTLGGVGGIG